MLGHEESGCENVLCNRIRTSGKTSFRIIYDDRLLLERERQNLHRMQTAKALLDLMNVHARVQEDYFYRNPDQLDRIALMRTLHLETSSRKQAMRDLDRQIALGAHGKTASHTEQRGCTARKDAVPVYSWLLPQLLRACNCKAGSRPVSGSIPIPTPISSTLQKRQKHTPVP